MSDFRSVERQSSLRGNIFSAECAVVLAIYLYVLLVPDAIYEHRPSGNVRSTMLSAYGCLYMVRLNVMARWLLPREIATEELTFVILVWIPGILASFAIPAVASPTDIGLVSLVLSLTLYVAGSFLNTWSEWERKLWKNKPENRGLLFTEGLFRFSRNINYFGDVLLFAGWAVATDTWWNAWVPVAMACSFYFHHIPDKEVYLAQKYSQDWPRYLSNTKALIPYLL